MAGLLINLLAHPSEKARGVHPAPQGVMAVRAVLNLPPLHFFAVKEIGKLPIKAPVIRAECLE